MFLTLKTEMNGVKWSGILCTRIGRRDGEQRDEGGVVALELPDEVVAVGAAIIVIMF